MGRPFRPFAVWAHGGRQKYVLWFLVLLLMPVNAPAEKPKSAGLVCLTQENPGAIPVNESIAVGEDITIHFDRYEIADTFQYSPSGGFSSVVLSAKEGYCLLCLYFRVESETPDEVGTAIYQNMELLAGDDPAVTARGSFFQTIQKGMIQNPFQKKASLTMEGYLLFALPEDAVASGQRLTIALYYRDAEYSCCLNPEASRAEEPQEGTK